MQNQYASVIIEISVKSLDRPFTYLIPKELAQQVAIGRIVEIPFGQGNRLMRGYIVDITDKANYVGGAIKAISKVYEDMSVETELIQLARWMQKRYGCTLQSALKTLLPTRPDVKKKSETIVQPLLDMPAMMHLYDAYLKLPKYKARVRVIACLMDNQLKPIGMRRLLEEASCQKGVVEGLVKSGYLALHNEEQIRSPYDVDDFTKSYRLELNNAQKIAVDKVIHSLDDQKGETFLLHGITGSGKTEVYMQLIDHVIKAGKTAIVLIPEIALTSQTVSRFVRRFGDIIGIMHSRLSEGERFDQWRQAKEGHIKIMIGPRSAVFAPLSDIGVIILDEEHEGTYKSETSPKYHAREVAIYRGHYHHCPVILGSATPLVESYYKAKQHLYQLLELKDKAMRDSKLQVALVDMRMELATGNKSILSRQLEEALQKSLDNKEQSILFINRRGHSRFVSCRQCGYVAKCQHCDIPYTFHAYHDKLICHYCNHQIKMFKTCPSCGSPYIKTFGIGTQKVEALIKDKFPGARVLRMDYDTTRGKTGHEELINAFKNHEADILIGTQMIAKGHHFKKVTLVGVLAADMSLFANDFRASERTFQLVTQVVGRTGRSDTSGLGIIQSYAPEHYSLVAALHQDYLSFYEKEIAYRQLMNYPPFGQILAILLSGPNEKELIELSYVMKAWLDEIKTTKALTVLGPSQASLSKIKDIYRRVIYVKHDEYQILSQVAVQFYHRSATTSQTSSVQVAYDINPMMPY